MEQNSVLRQINLENTLKTTIKLTTTNANLVSNLEVSRNEWN